MASSAQTSLKNVEWAAVQYVDRRARAAAMVAIPTILHVGLVWIPTIASIFLSFTDWNGIRFSDMEWVGLRNYYQIVTAFRRDFFQALINNSVLLIFLVRPIALRRLNRSTPGTVSNAARLIGLPCQVLDPVTGRSGLVRLEGDTWSARSVTGEPLPAGSDVYVHGIEGATVLVAPYPAPAADGGPAPRPSF